jgi:hypothetical protein
MDKVDFRKTLDAYQATRGQLRLVEVPEMGYLMVDGHGDPNSSQLFGDSIEALYPIAYALKFASKVELGVTTWSHRWRACGGRTTCRRSRWPATRPSGAGRS